MAVAQVARMQHKTLEERVYDELVKLIATGVLAPGAQIDEHELATRLGISRTPLRAALARLIQEGLVVTAPYRSASVRRFSAKEVDGLYQTRIVLEQFAIQRACEQIDSVQLAELERIVATCEAARRMGDSASLAVADTEFHRLIAVAADNSTLAELLDSLNLRIQGLRHIAIAEVASGRDEAPGDVHDRELILHAIRARDAQRADRLDSGPHWLRLAHNH